MPLLPRATQVNIDSKMIQDRRIDWRALEDKGPEVAYPALEQYLAAFAAAYREPYQRKLRNQALGSSLTRLGAIVLACIAAFATPITTLFEDDRQKVVVATFAVGFVLLASVTLLFDQVYGWSRSLLRYASTIANIDEALSRSTLELQSTILSLQGPITPQAVVALFSIYSKYRERLHECVRAESEGWAVEFVAGLGALNGFVTTTGQGVDRLADASQKALAAAQGREPVPFGAIEVSVSPFKNLFALEIRIDEEDPQAFSGDKAVVPRVGAGIHRLRVGGSYGTTAERRDYNSERAVVVRPGEVADVLVTFNSELPA